MSTPENPLAKYKTYSYYHSLAVCSNTSVAQELYRRNDIADFTVRSDYKPQSLADGSYVVLANGSTDAHFMVSGVKWAAMMAPRFGSEYFGTIATEGQIDIQEPRGVRFMNVVVDALRDMGIDAMVATYVLKTVFVGHSADGTRDEYTSVKPLLFLVTDIAAEFSIVGGQYVISFLPLANGANKFSHINTASDHASTLTISKGEPLTKAFTELTTQINSAYDKHYEKVIGDVSEVVEPLKVRYEIKAGPDYTSDIYKIDDFPKSTSNTGEDSVINFGMQSTVESAIAMIMRHCTLVKDEATNPKNTDKFIYKINTLVETSISEVKVIYVVDRYKQPISPISAAIEGNEEIIEPGNILELDYIYSGKNIDILDFEMRMAQGLMFLQTISTTDNEGKNKDNAKADSGAPITSDGTKTQSKIKTPIFFSTKDKNALTKHSRAPLSATTFQDRMSRFAALEGLDAKVTITGNPVFLNNLIKLPQEIKDSQSTGTADDDVARDHGLTPTLCKVNIFMPKNDDLATFEPEQFWYRGLYYIFEIENSFDDGIFTQTLDIMSLPVDLGFDKEENTDKDTTEIPENQNKQ